MVKLLVISDLESRFKEIKEFRKKVDLVLSIGSTLDAKKIPINTNLSKIKDQRNFKSLSKKERKLAPILFLQDGTLGSLLNFKFEKTYDLMQEFEFKNILFLGKLGIIDIMGVKIAYINAEYHSKGNNTYFENKK